MNWLVAGIVAIVFIVFGVAILDAAQPTISIKKAEWTCTKQGLENSYGPVIGSKTGQMVPTVETICVQYTQTNHLGN